MKKILKDWYSTKSIVSRLRWATSAIGVIIPINALTEKQLRNC